MTKHFRVIEGGRRPRKDGLGEPPQRAVIPELRHIDGGGIRPRYKRPTFEARSFDVERASGKTWRKSPDIDRGFIAVMLVAPLMLFFTIWHMLPDASPAAAPLPFATSGDQESASFSFCHTGGGYNCVVDGDTLYYKGTKIRIADIDTPETHPPRCDAEAAKGAAATRRMQDLVNAGPFTLAPNPDGRDEDVYGRKLRIVTRGGESLGGVLVDEGLARWYEGGRRSWC